LSSPYRRSSRSRIVSLAVSTFTSSQTQHVPSNRRLAVIIGSVSGQRIDRSACVDGHQRSAARVAEAKASQAPASDSSARRRRPGEVRHVPRRLQEAAADQTRGLRSAVGPTKHGHLVLVLPDRPIVGLAASARQSQLSRHPRVALSRERLATRASLIHRLAHIRLADAVRTTDPDRR
jgi:hypothetical protein